MFSESLTRKIEGLPPPWLLRFRRIAEAVDRIVELRSEPGAGCSISARERAAGWGCWTPPNVRRRFRFPRIWCRASSRVAKLRWPGRPRPPKTTRQTGRRDLVGRGFTGRDALVGIAASGRTPYVLGAVTEARKLGALTVGISCTPDSRAVAAGRDRDHAAGGSGGDRRLHAHESGHRHQAGAEHDQHGGHDPAGTCVTAI